MRDKHIYIAEDSELLKFIYQQVEKGLIMSKVSFIIRILLKFVFYFGIFLFAYTMLYYIENRFVFVLWYMIYGFSALLFAFNFSHDLAHNTIFSNKWLNNLCFIIIYTIVGAHAEAWKQRHINSHHYAPNVEEYDSDLKITKLIRVIPDSQYLWYHRNQHIYAPFAYATYSLYWVFIKDFVILFFDDEYTFRKGLKYHVSFWLQKLVYISIVLLFPLMFSLQTWYIVLIGFIAMHLSQSLFLLYTFFMTHHVEGTAYPITDENGLINTSWFRNQIMCSNDMYPFSVTANFVLGGFNNHIAHHLFPHYHHIYYPELNKILYRVLIDHDFIPNQTTYWGGVVSHMRLLKKMGIAYNN